MTFHQMPVGLPVYNVAQIKLVEQTFAKKTGNGTFPLMEKAGKAAFELLQREWPKARKILILAGKGNNGGDGLIVARLAELHGLNVSVCLFCNPEDLAGDAALAWQKIAVNRIQWVDWDQLELSDYDLVVDALLGTGIRGEVREPFASVIDSVNHTELPVLAIDIPSGLDADCGIISNFAINAAVTITFVGLKRGLYTGDAAEVRGRVELASLDIFADCYPLPDETILAHDWSSLKSHLPKRKATAHKGDFGRCRIIGGGKGMSGAVILAATAAARSGAGLTSAWLESGEQALLSYCPEVMARNVDAEAIESCCESIKSSDSLVVGPGLGRSTWAQSWMRQLEKNLTFNEINKVIDADALNWLSENPAFNEHWILTPHPGEAGRLLGISTSQVNSDRFSSSLQIAQRYGGVCVLKGAGTIISNQQGRQVVCAVGNPGMASGGMGDVLSGIIGGLLAQGFSLFDAAQLGVCLHGEAADQSAGGRHLYRGLLASDLIGQLKPLLNP